MGMSLRVVVPPHPLIGHWLTLLRERSTPPPLFGTAMAELGRWLTYEAVRDWLPQRRLELETPLARTEGVVVDSAVPLLVIPMLRAGLGLWQGGVQVLPAAAVAHVALRAEAVEGPVEWILDTLPTPLEERLGVLIYVPTIGSGASLLALLERLRGLGVAGDRLRVITALASAPGLKAIGERIPELTIYCACIDAELDAQGRILPGCGDPVERLYGFQPGPGETPA